MAGVLRAHSDSVTPRRSPSRSARLLIMVLVAARQSSNPGPFVALIVTTVGGRAVPPAGRDDRHDVRRDRVDVSAPASFRTSRSRKSRRSSRPAFTIALLGAIESLLSAVVADGMIGGRHRSNMELIAQGVANIASPLFGGMPATGAIARTATNVKNGGRTPVAGMVHALTLLLITLFFGRWAALIPMATLAGDPRASSPTT